MRIDLSNRAFLVTGAGSGIGEACARTIAGAGGMVWVNDLNAAAAERVATSIAGASAMPGDVANPDWTSPIEELHGIVHCAGYDAYSPIGETDMELFERLHRVMVSGPFDMTQRLLPKLQREGCIVFVASVHAIATEPGTSAYASAKGAQVSMTRSMALDLGPRRIRVLSVSPGYVDTPLLRRWIDGAADPVQTRAHAESVHPLGRLGKPEDIAQLVTFLLSPLAEFVNATNVVIDGGLTAQLPG
jgi:NAD(P)-dependent dehydrogenase (short-subunit alcohol dehydrogenase family)